MTKPLRCPFCGRLPVIKASRYIDELPDDPPHYTVWCHDPGHDVRVIDPDRNTAVARWNKRHVPAT